MEGLSYNRTCIDRSIHGCSVCRGYCRFHGHSGYLTAKQMSEHRCLEKGCHYFVQKEKRERVTKAADGSAAVVCAAQRQTESLEGLKVLRAKKTDADTWTVYYVAIAKYVLEGIEDSLSQAIGESVRFAKLDYSFDNAVRIIMG